MNVFTADFDLRSGSLAISADHRGKPGRTESTPLVTGLVAEQARAVPCHQCPQRRTCRTECGRFVEYVSGEKWSNKRRWSARKRAGGG